ncbi:MAG: 2-amino-4-hydroxy-6-hydroxymethyldihydropteridine diphosphokinase [Halioglobus sp.]|nr:2-amino-4-hydroxy-6-hydroxymethyldihydropteridine diphosphokinase [Halioglobus sp.]
MATVYLGLGSNIEREHHINVGLDALDRLFGEPELSPVYDSPAIGFAGEPFLNLVARVRTTVPVTELAATLRHVETLHGRLADAPRYSPRQLDIDILTYDDLVGRFGHVTLPREEILHNAFVLRPLAELAPDGRHPVSGRRYADLWREFDAGSQPLERVHFRWRGRVT